ncbi:helix-turn-helix transcriptional regulator [Bosea beijingensis]|uniref:helix-turn-helix transcriptional regulator n=1 Tax=Bosea beijingensis TaxID=3068632 RepID=UPI0027405FCC|nr:AraC family transcriptional regulator [Bosea sp. REN20]
MDPVKAAIWCIESRFTAELTLDEIAEVSGVSRFHLSRAFGVATGRSVMRYVRERRLSEAARQLANGAPDILSVALDWGYGSHEAFTRAFREQFGITPEELRARRDLSSLALVEPLNMHDITPAPIAEPRIVTGKPS